MSPTTDPYAPAANLVPWGTRVATPSDAEERVLRDTLAFVWQRTGFLPSSQLRTIWFVYDVGADDPLRGLVLFSQPPVLLLRAGRRLEDLRRTIVHEARHLWQSQYHLDTWSPAEREADAEAFVARLMRR